MAATSTPSMESRATAAWRPHRAWPAPTNACSAGGKVLEQLCFGRGHLLTCHVTPMSVVFRGIAMQGAEPKQQCVQC